MTAPVGAYLNVARQIGAGCFAPRLRLSALAAALAYERPQTACRAIFRPDPVHGSSPPKNRS